MAQDTTPAIVVYQGDGTNRVFSIPFDAGSGVINVEFILRGATQTYEYSPLAFTVNDDNTALTWNGEPLQVGDFICISRSTTAHSLAMYEGDGVQTEFEIPFIRGFYGSIGVAFVYRGATQTYEYEPKTFYVDANNTLLTWTGATLNAGDYITIGRSTITGQPYEFSNNQKHIEGALDNLSRQIQELKDRAVLVIDPTYRIGAPGKQNPIDWLKSIVRSKDFSVRGLRYDGKFLQFSLDDPDMPEHSKSWASLLNTINVTTFREVYNEDEGAYYLQYSKDNGSTWHAVGTGKGDIDKILAQANAYSDEQNALLESKINGKLTAVESQIDANADAIQKTREDYINADSEIHQILNNHADELTTLRGNQASLGDQVSGIEEKIPESASATNPLITKQQLLDEEMDIRDDLNEMASELQTQITAQAAEIATKQDQLIAGDNITIVDNVISATGGGGGGGIANVIHDATLTGSGTNASPLGLAETIKDEIADKAPKETVEALTQAVNGIIGDYLPLSGGTLTGALSFDVTGDTYSYVPIIVNADGESIISAMSDGAGKTTGKSVRIDKLSAVELTSQKIGGAYNAAQHIYVAKIGSGKDASLLTVPDGTGTIARVEDIADAVANIDALPDQTGNAGKVLTTDGSTASWQEPQGGGTKIIIKRYN